MPNGLHVYGCFCRFKHFDAITAEGERNLTTYEIDYDCHMNGVTAGKGTGWTIIFPKE